MTTTAIKTIDLKNFPIEKTIFWLLQDKDQRQELVKKEIESWKARFPSAETAISKYLTKYGVEVPDADGDKAISNYLTTFDIENDILKEAKPDTTQKLDKLLSKKSEDGIVELVRTIAQEQQGDLESEVKNWKVGVLGLAFLLDSVEKYYLKDLPEYIKGKLEIAEPVALNELNQEQLKTSVSNIFATLYTGFTSTEKQEDFNSFQEGINTELGNIKTLIDEVRKAKEPAKPTETETEKKLKEELETKTKELDNLKEAWKNNFVDRKIKDADEYLKGKELSVDAINEVANSLKTYDDTFAYMFNNFEPSKTNNWWSNIVRPYWKENFFGKWGNEGYKGGIDATTLKQLKEYIESKEKEFVISKENVGLLTNWCLDLIKMVHKYDRQPDLLYETTPTPPNSPETNPQKDNVDIPPIKT